MTTFPGIAGEIEQVIGVELTTLMMRRWGGCEVFIPKHAPGTKLAEVIGPEAAAKVIREIGHGKIVLPCGAFRGAKRRRAEATDLYRPRRWLDRRPPRVAGGRDQPHTLGRPL